MAGMTSNGFDPDEDFYEEDEPLEKILDAYEHGLKGVTARPAKIELSSPPALLLPTSSGATPANVALEPSLLTTPREAVPAGGRAA